MTLAKASKEPTVNAAGEYNQRQIITKLPSGPCYARKYLHQKLFSEDCQQSSHHPPPQSQNN